MKRHADVVWFNGHFIVKIHYSIKIISPSVLNWKIKYKSYITSNIATLEMSVENEYIQMGEEGIHNTAEETKNKVSKYNKGKEIGYF